MFQFFSFGFKSDICMIVRFFQLEAHNHHVVKHFEDGKNRLIKRPHSVLILKSHTDYAK